MVPGPFLHRRHTSFKKKYIYIYIYIYIEKMFCVSFSRSFKMVRNSALYKINSFELATP